jgi:hypothetical protein
MFKGSSQINPQALKVDYSGIERAAAIKQQTLADLGGVISQGIKSHQKRQEEKLKKESAMAIIRDHAKQSGRTMSEQDVKDIYGNSDSETILKQGAILRDLAQYDASERKRIAAEEATITALNRANEIAKARNAIAKKQAAASRMNAKRSLLGARAEKRRDREEFNTGKKHRIATSASIQAMNTTDAQGNRVTPSINAALDEYKRQGGNKAGEFAKEFYATYPEARKYSTKYKDDQGNEKTALVINGQLIPTDNRSTVLKAVDNLVNRKDAQGNPLFSEAKKNEILRELTTTLTSKSGGGADAIDAMIVRLIEPQLRKQLGLDEIPSVPYK